jgi:hypothetical protein
VFLGLHPAGSSFGVKGPSFVMQPVQISWLSVLQPMARSSCYNSSQPNERQLQLLKVNQLPAVTASGAPGASGGPQQQQSHQDPAPRAAAGAAAAPALPPSLPPLTAPLLPRPTCGCTPSSSISGVFTTAPPRPNMPAITPVAGAMAEHWRIIQGAVFSDSTGVSSPWMMLLTAATT